MEEVEWSPLAKEYDPTLVGSIDGTDIIAHDKAIIRAIESEYVPNSSLKSDPHRSIFVGRLHPKVTEDELEKMFSEYGTIKSCTLIRDIVTGASKQYAFIQYSDTLSANKAYRYAHKRMLHASEILVDREFGRTMKNWKPRRLGGGFGGKKESGQLRFGCRDRRWQRPILLSSHSNNKNYDKKK